MKETLQNVLEFSLIEIKEYTITVADLFVIALLFIGARVLNYMIKKSLVKIIPAKTKSDLNRKNAIVQIAKYLVYVIFIFLALEAVDVDVSLLLAGSAALLVGLGFGLQNIFNDLVSGVIILVEGNVNTGDIVEVDSLVGRVELIGLRTSRLLTRENITIVVPNSHFISSNVINWSHGNFITRFLVTVGVTYGSDVELVRELLMGCTKENERVLEKPMPFVRFVDFGDSSLDFELHFWSENIWLIEDTKSDIRFRINTTFKENGIVIPFPQRDLHIKSSQVAFTPNGGQNEENN